MIEGLPIGWMISGIVVHGFVGGGMFFCVYRIMTMGIRDQWMKQGFDYIVTQTRQNQQKREIQYQKQYEEIGIQDNLPLIQRWDQSFAQSMIQQKYPVMNAQLYGCLLLLGASVCGLIGIFVMRAKPLLAVGAGGMIFAIVLAGGIFYVNLLRRRKWKQTEKELMPFLNILDNFSKSEQDLFQLFEMATPYLQEPIRSALSQCGKHAAATGNRREAIRDLIYRIEHPKFREMVQNLEICSRNEANYTRILGDMRDSLSAYMSNRKEAAGILREGQIQITVITCMGIPMIAMLTAITQIPISGMMDNFFGRFIIGYWIVLILFIVYQMFFAESGKES